MRNIRISASLRACILCVLIVIMNLSNASAQLIPANPTVPSASIAGSKQSVEVSNDLYNGKLNLAIPVYSYGFEGISFPFILNYVAGNGIKPDELPGWVGTGWNLQASGFVHRTVRGEADERIEFESTIYGTGNNRQKKTVQNTQDYSYITNRGLLNDNNWSTPTFAQSKSSPNPNISVPISNYVIHNTYPTYDLAPDEFTFSLGPVSGKFYLSHQDVNNKPKWLVQASDGMKYEVHLELGEQTVIDFNGTGIRSYFKVPRIIKYLTLTSESGIRYVFGNENMSAPFNQQYFEYSYGSEPLSTLGGPYSAPAAYVDGNVAPTLMEFIPHTWHLTKIENLKTNAVVTFNYKEQMQFYRTHQPKGSGEVNNIDNGQLIYRNDQSATNDPDEIFGYRTSANVKVMTRGWVLTTITFSNGVKIDFNSTPSVQRSSTDNVYNSYNCGFYDQEDVFAYFQGRKNTMHQLNDIVVSFNGLVKKKIKFNYALSASQRLQLTSLTQKDLLDRSSNTYSFNYNITETLPDYGSSQLDHWGFYNGKDFFNPVLNKYGYTALSGYYDKREPDALKAQAELLTKVSLPTGGYMAFQYGAHDYAKKRINYFTISNMAGTAGGVRIEKISHYLQDGVLASEKVYDYKVPGTASSSGVLAAQQPEYLTTFTLGTLRWQFSAEGFNPIYYEGGNVAYTFVTEKQVGNGKTVFEFTNYDNGYNDGPAVGSNASLRRWGFPTAFAHKAFKRGKLIHVNVFSETGPVKETDYHYEHEESEVLKDELRVLYLGLRDSNQDLYTAVLEKIYPDRLTSQEERLLTSDGTITTKNTYSYDAYGNIAESSTFNSEGKKIRQKFKYNYEYATTGTDEAGLGLKKLNDLGIKNEAVESVTIREDANGNNPVVIGGILNTFKPGTGFPDKVYNLRITDPFSFPSFVWSTVSGNNFSKDLHYAEPDLIINNTDAKGNILQATKKDNIKESFQWGYNGMHITAKVINAANANGIKEFYYNGFEEEDVYQSLVAYAGGYYFSGDYTVSFSPPNPKNYMIDYRYFDNGKWNFARKSYTNGMVLSEGTAIDEVRVYPSDAQMATYTFSVFNGMTSATDANGKTTFYEFDEFGRLAIVRDNDKNVIKTICYNLSGETENCNYSYNDAISQAYNKGDCPYTAGGPVTYSVPAGKYLSSFGKAAANQLAQAEADAKGPAYANAHGTCSPFYIKFKEEPLGGGAPSAQFYSNFRLEFFKDAACTIPLTVSNLVLRWGRASYLYNGNEYYFDEFDSNPISGTYTYLLHNAITREDGFDEIHYYYSHYYYYSLLSNPAFNVIYVY